ncbi:AAA family ATPase [Mobiluncus mulieris]|uniref:Divergent AAA domain protein n=2 Tax=Mobiluncus mulieris TaxID=2052 RepID=E0QNZ2_9ACTO|nr:RNA-binding domain-containing protein [Mobiluncus mulieris]EFM46725.1 divergent AAA domain protein [Mobiluncus mulieris ATCC 35239]MBB5846972.1 ATP-dependent DNA helicase RecG [Mobiluncus mulieris]MCU9971603.1 AAA family ATPase [Mobiluncus mulieris]MCU9976141.1 AAA family ATPase [Mobiluncus mulieris]MCU9994554.1 AAA family ATPase [Mobiluncus mulieris]
MLVSDSEFSHIVDDLRRRGSDDAAIEVKSGKGGVPTVGETLSAFANMPDGGLLIVGLSDPDFLPVGLKNLAGIEAGIASQARSDAMNPKVKCYFQTVTFAGKEVLVVKVEPQDLSQRPVYYQGTAYLRQSEGDYPMSDQELAQIELMKSINRPRDDARSLEETSEGDLDPGLVEDFVINAKNSSSRLMSVADSVVLQRTGVVKADGHLSVAGVYALGKYPQQFLPELGVTAAVKTPRGDRRLDDLTHFDGPIPTMLDEILYWVARNTRRAVAYREDGNAVDVPEFPMNAVRELVANALVHRSLSNVTASKRVEIRLTPDRLVIASPGGLWGVSEKQLGYPGAKSAVNPTLYDICKKVYTQDKTRVIEGEGGGLIEANRAFAEAGLDSIRYRNTGTSFTAIAFRPDQVKAPQVRGESDMKQPVELQALPLGKNPLLVIQALPGSVASISNQTGLTPAQVRYALKKLMAQGLVKMKGGLGHRNSSYSLVLK